MLSEVDIINLENNVLDIKKHFKIRAGDSLAVKVCTAGVDATPLNSRERIAHALFLKSTKVLQRIICIDCAGIDFGLYSANISVMNMSAGLNR